jgi:hypothetical protein
VDARVSQDAPAGEDSLKRRGARPLDRDPRRERDEERRRPFRLHCRTAAGLDPDFHTELRPTMVMLLLMARLGGVVFNRFVAAMWRFDAIENDRDIDDSL